MCTNKDGSRWFLCLRQLHGAWSAYRIWLVTDWDILGRFHKCPSCIVCSQGHFDHKMSGLCFRSLGQVLVWARSLQQVGSLVWVKDRRRVLCCGPAPVQHFCMCCEGQWGPEVLVGLIGTDYRLPSRLHPGSVILPSRRARSVTVWPEPWRWFLEWVLNVPHQEWRWCHPIQQSLRPVCPNWTCGRQTGSSLGAIFAGNLQPLWLFSQGDWSVDYPAVSLRDAAPIRGAGDWTCWSCCWGSCISCGTLECLQGTNVHRCS